MELPVSPKVVLINPPSPWLLSDREQPPLGLLDIASYLRVNNIDVTFCDLAGFPEKYWFIPDGDIYGITCATPHYSIVIKIIEKIKKRQPDAVVVVGGFHPTVEPERTLRDTKADIAIKGEGEQAMLDIVKGRRERIITCPLVEDINKIPMPAFDMVDMYDYVKMGTNLVIGSTPNNKEAKLMTARGCPFDCTFCAQASVSKRRMRYKTVERVIEEIKFVHKRYGVDRIYFIDDTFIVDDKRVVELCKSLKELHDKGILYDWHCLTRADRTDKELFRLMYQSGCRMVTYGIETGSQKILDIIEKQTTVEENMNAIKLAKEMGLKVRAQMIVGLPGETRETVEESAEFIRKAPADSFGMHIFVPLPGCQIWYDPERFDFPIDKESTFEYYHTIGKREEEDAAYLHKNPQQIIEWKNYLVRVIGERNIVKFAEVRGMENDAGEEIRGTVMSSGYVQ
ncbi:B12-binding domain-containing radical SAM protein [Candidatus Woesearchaeota archaeon]|nr:B12-binding domain-containing radical SAM protein [Candidatus Woesearchaeota archaeon]